MGTKRTDEFRAAAVRIVLTSSLVRKELKASIYGDFGTLWG
ncbi:MAG: hypothetical protein AAF408_11730 [Pseudomonadota bacterium]